jgi:hypothetical protein
MSVGALRAKYSRSRAGQGKGHGDARVGVRLVEQVARQLREQAQAHIVPVALASDERERGLTHRGVMVEERVRLVHGHVEGLGCSKLGWRRLQALVVQLGEEVGSAQGLEAVGDEGFTRDWRLSLHLARPARLWHSEAYGHTDLDLEGAVPAA